MANEIVSLYRKYLADTGQSDDRDDFFITQQLGEWAQRNRPDLFETLPEFGKQWGDIREANAPSLADETGRAFKRAGIGLGSTALGGAALITGSDYLKRKAAALELQASDPELAATVPTLEDIEPGEKSTAKKVFSRDAVRYGLSKVGEAVPSIGEGVALAGVGAAIGSAIEPGLGTAAGAITGAAEATLGRGIIKSAIKSLVKKGMTEEAIVAGLRKGVPEVVSAVTSNAKRIAALRGGTAASAVNSYLLNSGEVYGENDDRATAAGLGLISAIPDTILPALVVRRMFPGVSLSAGREAAKELVGNNAVKVAKAAGVTALEGGTETFQEAVNIAARNLKEGVDPFTITDADKIRLREAGITGAVGGALASPAVVLGGESQEVAVQDRPVAAPVQSITPIEPPAPLMPEQPVEVPVSVSPVQRIRAMPPEQQSARLAELEVIPSRSQEEEQEYQILRAVAPRVSAAPVQPLTQPQRAPEIQIASAVDVFQQPGDGEIMGGGNAIAQEPAGAITPSQEVQAPVAPQVQVGQQTVTPKGPAPVEYLGRQQGFGSIPDFDFFNLLEDIPGHPAGSSLARETLEGYGYTVPPAPVQVATPTVPAGLGLPPAQAPQAMPAPVPVEPAVVASEPIFTPSPQAAPTPFTLPKELAGAKPRYSYGAKQFTLQFEDDLDKATYILAQKMPSKREADYLREVITQTGMTEAQAREQGVQVRERIKQMAKSATGGETLVVPSPPSSQSAPVAPQVTHQVAPQVAPQVASEAVAQNDFQRLDALTAQHDIALAKMDDEALGLIAKNLGIKTQGMSGQRLKSRILTNAHPDDLQAVLGGEAPAFRTTTEPNNPAVQATRTQEFQAVMGRLVSNGANVQAMSQELLAQQTGEMLQQQIAALQQRLAQATTAPQRNELQKQIAIREQRMAEVEQMRGVTYSPYHIAVAMEDTMNASLDNLVTLLHEAAESLTMRLPAAQQGAVMRAVEATFDEMYAKMQVAAKNTGATVADVPNASELLAESMAQKFAAEGIPESSSLADAIVRWVKEIYYRVAMAAQRAFGAEPNLEMALDWYENQLRRELGGDYQYSLGSLLDRLMPQPNQNFAAKFTGKAATPGGIVDFFDPVTQTLRQPWVNPFSEEALNWNMKFQTSGANPGESEGILSDEARDRQAAAAYNEQIEWLEKMRNDIAPKMDPLEFYGQFRVGEKTPQEMLASLEAKRAGVSSAKIGGERMTPEMNQWANYQVLQFIRALQEKNISTIAKTQESVTTDEEKFTDHARELNRLESDVRNAELHETELKEKAKNLIEGLLKSYKNGFKTSSKLGEMVQAEENLGDRDPLPQFYAQAFANLMNGGVKLFDYVEAIALLDLPVGTMKPEEIWKAIRENSDTSPRLRELSRNKPLAMTVSVLASNNARQLDQMQLRRADADTFLNIRTELEGIRNATEAQLREMLKTIDDKNAAKGLRERIKLEYLKERRGLKRTSDRLAAAEERIALLTKAKPALTDKVGQAEQAIGGIFSDWQPESGADFTVMRRKEDGTFEKANRRLEFNPDGSAVDSEGLLNDLAQNMQWLKANKSREGQKEYNRIKQQTERLQLLDVQRSYQAANFGKTIGLIDKFVRPLQAIARQAGNSSGARINAQFNKYEFINRSGAKALTPMAPRWTSAYKGAMKAAGIKDYGQFRSQVYNPVMFFLGVNPGLDQAQAIREATRQARARLTATPTPDFNEKFERLLLATKEVNDELVRTAEQNGVLVSDPKLGGELRRAISRGWLTGMRGMNDGVVVTLINDMEKAGWKLALNKDGGVAKAITFDALNPENAKSPEERAEYYAQLENTEALNAAIKPYFTPGVLDRWLKPFINKPGESVFSYDGRDIPQLDLQAAWAKSGGDVLNWIDLLGQTVDVKAEDGASPSAAFRWEMLKQIDQLFGWEARMAYEANQTPDLFNNQGSKLHVLMDARVNDLLPPEHVDFAMHDPQSVQQMLGQIAFHGAFGRNAQALVANLKELEGTLAMKRANFNALPSTSVEGKKRDAKALGFDYDDLKRAVEHYQDVAELKGEIETAMGVKNVYGPLHDARAGMELLGFMVGQVVDQPKTGALNFLSLGARPFAMHSLSPKVLKATALSYGELAKNSFGGMLRDFGIDLVRMSDFAKETGEVEGKAFRRLPFGVVLSGDMGREGSFQDGLMNRFVVQPLRILKAVQKKGVGPGLASIPGLGTMQRFATEGAIANNRGQLYLLQEIINNGIKYFASHPSDLANPAFRFNAESLKLKHDRGMYDWFRDKTVEYNMGPIESIVRAAIERQKAGERTITTKMVEQLAQMNAQELDGASSINTSPASLTQNQALRMAMPLLRWPLWMMHAAHNGLADADGKIDFKSFMRGVGRLAAWNLPLGLAFTFMVDEYDEKILGKKNAMPEIEKVGAVPFVGPALALATTERGIPQEALAIGQRMIRSGNIYGLGGDIAQLFIAPFDPGSGQRTFSLDQRVLVMSQLLNMSQAVSNMVSQGGTSTWGSVYRPFVASIGGNGMLNSLGVVNNLLNLDNSEARLTMRINAARWVNTAAKEIGIETKKASGFSNPSPMSVWTREMQLAAMANNRLDFMEAYRRALIAAREKVSADDRVPASDREREAAQRVLQSWRSRNPFSGLAATPTPEQIQQLLQAMDEDGRADVTDAMQRYQAYTQLIAPSKIEQTMNRRMRAIDPQKQMDRLRRQAAGAMMGE